MCLHILLLIVPPHKLSDNRSIFFDTSSQNFKRTKIKINFGESYSGETEIYVRAVLDRSLYRESWRDCNNRAVRVNALLDKEIIVNNFEWKVEHTALGTIYFNY